MWLLYEWTLDRVGGSGDVATVRMDLGSGRGSGDVATVRMDLGSGRGEWGCGCCTNGPWMWLGAPALSQHIGWSWRAASRPKTEDDGALLLLLLLQPLAEGAGYLNPHSQSLLAVLHARVGL